MWGCTANHQTVLNLLARLWIVLKFDLSHCQTLPCAEAGVPRWHHTLGGTAVHVPTDHFGKLPTTHQPNMKICTLGEITTRKPSTLSCCLTCPWPDTDGAKNKLCCEYSMTLVVSTNKLVGEGLYITCGRVKHYNTCKTDRQQQITQGAEHLWSFSFIRGTVPYSEEISSRASRESFINHVEFTILHFIVQL